MPQERTHMATKGKSLELFFVDGNPEGMLTAEVFNWTGHVLSVPRQQLLDGLKRREASYTGVYLLLGEHESGRPLAYVGESEDVASRIRTHDANKEWWNRVIIITSAANNLHKAHVKYLESRLVEIALDVAHAKLDNGNQPPRSSLTEAAQANMEAFLETLDMVLPAIRVDIFVSRARPSLNSSPESHKQFTEQDNIEAFDLHAQRAGVAAQALLIRGEFIVQAGSIARAEWSGVDYATYHNLYHELRTSGVLARENGHCVFTRNYAFPSPSAASSVVLGRSSNGQTDWRHTATGMSYKEWESRLLSEQEKQADG